MRQSGEMKNVRVIVRGRVQGVGFRWFTRDEAQTRGLTGWVRNLDDGSVEAELHGTAGAVNAVLDALRAGPAHAQVESVETMPASSAAIIGFEIRQTGRI